MQEVVARLAFVPRAETELPVHQINLADGHIVLLTQQTQLHDRIVSSLSTGPGTWLSDFFR